MKRDYRFDIARVVCMTFIVAFVHLFAYIYSGHVSAYFIPACAVLTDACLGLFTFTSGYLLGLKYDFSNFKGVWVFYKKRLLRIIPLFLIASLVLYLIGFNSLRATINGVLCISLFVKPRPMTLWYIPVILFCYLVTPLVCRKGFLWRLISALGLICCVWVLRKFIPSIDWRFQFNMLFYFVGLVSSRCCDWMFSKTTWIKWLVVVLFFALLIVSQIYSPGAISKRVFAGVGVFAVLFVCEGLSRIVFKRDNLIAKIVKDISYASMACYLFHRFFFWGGEMIWNPSIHWVKWLYMLGLVFPAMIVLSYYIQKYYDWMVDRLKQ